MYRSFILLFALALLIACKPEFRSDHHEPLDKQGSNGSIVSSQINRKQEIGEAINSFPSSYKLALLFARESDLKKVNDYAEIYPIDRFNTDAEKLFALGLYQANMSFAAAFGNREKLYEYSEAIADYSQTIGIHSFPDAQLLTLLQDTSRNDSLPELYRQLFIQIELILKTRIEQTNAIKIITASWLECMYLGSSSHAGKSEGYKRIIANEKKNLNKLILMLNSSEDSTVNELGNRLHVLAAIFEKVEVSNLSNTKDQLIIEQTDSINSINENPKMSDPVLHAIENEVGSIREYLLHN